jgi:hypothetical protein
MRSSRRKRVCALTSTLRSGWPRRLASARCGAGRDRRSCAAITSRDMLPRLKAGASAPASRAEIYDLQGKALGRPESRRRTAPRGFLLPTHPMGSLGRLFGQCPDLCVCSRASVAKPGITRLSELVSLRFLRGGLTASTAKPNLSKSSRKLGFRRRLEARYAGIRFAARPKTSRLRRQRSEPPT